MLVGGAAAEFWSQSAISTGEQTPRDIFEFLAAQGDELQPWLPLDPHPDFMARVMGVG